MRLVDHVGGGEVLRLPHLRIDEFIEDKEQAEGIDGAGVEIVVAILRVIEVEAGQLAHMDEPRHDLLDVGVGRMVAEINEALGLRAQMLGRHQA